MNITLEPNKNKKNSSIIFGGESARLKPTGETLVWGEAAIWTDNTSVTGKPKTVTSNRVFTGNRVGMRAEFNNTTTTTSITTNTNTQVFRGTDTKIESSLLPYMRAKRIVFYATGLKPNASIIALFDNENVTNLCKQTSHGKLNPVGESGLLYANGAGQLEGFFDLPDGKFKTGRRVFKLEDSVDKKITSAQASYTSSGTKLDVTTINYEHTERKIQNTITNNTTISTGWSDPVAQSFYVDTVDTNRGVYIHSVDLFFDTVDPGHEVLLQVRAMKNGYPTKELVYPYAWTKLSPNNMKRSSNGSIGSRFIFPSPLYLPSNEEYCFVAMSNSNKTTLWCSEMGQKSFLDTDDTLPSGEIISKQPYLGTMFISQNNSTWDATQNKDLKFIMNRCKFKALEGTVKCVNSTKNDITQLPNIRILKSNSLEFTQGSQEVRIYAHGHGLIPGDKFKLTFDGTNADFYGIPLAKLQNIPLTVKAAPNSVNGISATQIIFDVDKAGGANGSGSAGGDTIILEGWNIAYSYAQLLKDDLQLDNTNISYYLAGRKQSDYDIGTSSEYTQITTKEIVDLNEIYVIKDDEDGGISLDINLISSNNYISPMLNVKNIGVNTHLNIINNIDYLDISGTKQDNSSPAKYIQKEVNLINPSNELKVMFETNMLYSTKVSVYYKVGNTRIDDNVEWTRMNPDEGKLLYSDAPDVWRTQKFTNSFGNQYWNVFKIMIVLQSDDRRVSPIIKNYRAIALDAGPTI